MHINCVGQKYMWLREFGHFNLISFDARAKRLLHLLCIMQTHVKSHFWRIPNSRAPRPSSDTHLITLVPDEFCKKLKAFGLVRGFGINRWVFPNYFVQFFILTPNT